MTVTTTLWRRIAVVLSVFNVAGAGFALASAESWHAMVHISLAVAFAFGAQRLRQGAGGSDVGRMQQQLDEQAAALDDAQAMLANQATQLAELQERVDFAERLLIQARDRQALDR